MNPIAYVVRNCLVWLVGTVLLPIGLIGYLVWVEGASFVSAVGSGELFALGVVVAGAASVAEMILTPGRLVISLYQVLLVAILISNAMMFAGTAAVHRHKVITALDGGQVTASVALLAFAVVGGLGAVIRQSREQLT